MVVFRDAVESACGLAQAAVGPFYCPADETVYIDLSFFDELERRHNAPGDFAQAYVIAHEVGHHVQKLLGTTDKFDSLRSRLSQAREQRTVGAAGTAGRFPGRSSGRTTRNRTTAFSRKVISKRRSMRLPMIGDDRLQLEATGRIRPDAFTHGTSEQRMKWFRLGLTDRRHETGRHVSTAEVHSDRQRCSRSQRENQSLLCRHRCGWCCVLRQLSPVARNGARGLARATRHADHRLRRTGSCVCRGPRGDRLP